MQNEQNIWLFTDTPTTSEILIPDLYLGNNQMLPDDIECAISSRKTRNYLDFRCHDIITN